MCGDALCDHCSSDHKKKHGKRNLYLELDYLMQIGFETERKRGVADIYENEFHMSYLQCYHHNDREGRNFSLKARKAEGIMREFL